MSTATASPQQTANTRISDERRQDDSREQSAPRERTPKSGQPRSEAHGYWILLWFAIIFFVIGGIGLVASTRPLDLRASSTRPEFYVLNQWDRAPSRITCFKSLKEQPIQVRASFSINGRRPHRYKDAPSPPEDARVLFTLRPQGGSEAEALTYEKTWDITDRTNGVGRQVGRLEFAWTPKLPASFQGRPLVATARVFHSTDSNHANDSTSEAVLNPC